jgi:hypothetical protein
VIRHPQHLQAQLSPGALGPAVLSEEQYLDHILLCIKWGIYNAVRVGADRALGFARYRSVAKGGSRAYNHRVLRPQRRDVLDPTLSQSIAHADHPMHCLVRG